ncbi:MAG: hypothetical protein K0Q90_118 [Paenibacillaceae bacterium]|nr:hypothetical protein [Paenibacillaceae bacterium]
MNSETFIYITLITTSGALNVLLFLYALADKTRSQTMKAFAGVTATAALYCFGTALQLASSTLGAIKLWISVAYLGMAFSPPFLLILVYRYTGADKWLSRRVAGLLFVIPAITCLLVATNDLHHLFYKSVFLRPDAPSPMADIIIGPWYIVHGAYTFGSMFLGACLLVGQWRTASTVYRKQVFTLFLGTMLPIIASFLYLMGLIPYNMDPVPFILIFTTSLYVWAIRTTDLFQVVPIARGYVFESIRDGVLVLDLAGRLVDYNPAARGMIPALSPERIGEELDSVWAEEPGSEKLPREMDGQGDSERTWRTRWRGKGEERYFEIRSLPVRSKNHRQVGRMLMLIDVTEHVRYEEKLLRLASYDGLTGIYNRAHFMEEARRLLAEAEGSRSALSLVLFDVDHFKNINDRLGHSAGDQALVHLVDICRSELLEGEILGRYGGEEFVLCLPGIGLAEAGRRTELIRAAIAGSALPTSAGPLRLTASFGVVEAGGAAAGYGLEPLLQAADQALYQAKAAGRNAVHYSQGIG